MQEKNFEEKEIINGENQPETEQNLINNEMNINNEQLNNNNYEINNQEIINDNMNKEEEEIHENNLDKNEIITNDEAKKPIIDNKNNTLINENINNIDNINQNNNLVYQINPSQNMNLNNLSKEQREEIIEKDLRALLSELSNIKEQGNNYFNNKNYELAEEKYKEGIQKINEFQIIQNIDEVNGQINEHLININLFNSKFHNNLSTVLFKQKKYEESLKTAEYIIQNINKDHDVSYCRILYCLIELKKIILANHYAEIIKKKFSKEVIASKFQAQLDRLDKLNKEMSDKILNENPELKKELISLNNNMELNKEKEEQKEDENKIMKYIPYLVGGIAFLLIGGRYIYKKLKGN
jgi:tetratricopeptide (TPR) repeat protein